MPIYEFKCTSCGEIFELLSVRSDDRVELCCPHCSGGDVERVLSRVSFSTTGSDSRHTPSVTDRSCSGGSCKTITLPGHSR